jgi:hypothetical protein
VSSKIAMETRVPSGETLCSQKSKPSPTLVKKLPWS